MYQKILKIIEREIDLESLKRNSNQIYNYERDFSYKGFHKSADFCFNKFKESGASVEKIHLPADGKTTYLDHIIPEAWDIEDAFLEIVRPKVFLPILADHKKETFCVANRCAPTPKNGVIAEVVSYEEMNSVRDTSLTGKIVFTQSAHPGTIRKEVVKKGGLGIISSYSQGYSDLPDGTWWINGWGGGPGWYHTKEDKKIFCFSITPRKGNCLAELLKKGRVEVKAFVKSKVYNGSIDTVTALLAGQSEKEILLLAHLYEPMLNDDAVGGAALIEIAELLNRLIKKGRFSPLRRGIRFLISQERYGFAQFYQEKKRRERIIAALSLDGISYDCRKTNTSINVRMNPASSPFFGDLLLQNMAKNYLSNYPCRIERGKFSDDTFIADNTIGIPVNWLWTNPGKYHHNSEDSFDRITDWNLTKRMITLIATYTYFLAAASKKEVTYLKNLLLNEAKINILEESSKLTQAKDLRLPEKVAAPSEPAPAGLKRGLRRNKFDYNEARERLDFISSWQKGRLHSLGKLNPKEKTEDLEKEIEEITEREKKKFLSLSEKKAEKKIGLTKKERIAENMIIERKSVGFPFSLAKVAFEQRRNKPKFADEALNWADGKRDGLQIFQLLDCELTQAKACGYQSGENLSEKQFSDLIKYFVFLDKYGYIKIRYKVKLKKEEIKKSLKKLGIKKGDKLMVHSSLAALGYVEGGAKAVCSALMETVSEEGILMMPTFNHDAPFQKGGPNYYAPLETPTSNGVVPDTFWRMKGVYRSLNPTHPFAAWGKEAKGYVENHHKLTTMGEGSPLHLLEKNGGKVLLLGVDYHANTFHHTVEMTNNVPCLGKRTREYPVKLPGGRMVKLRTWSWREKRCPIDDNTEYVKVMREKGWEKRIKIGIAEAILFKMSDCRTVIEELLKKGIKGFPGCKSCNIRPKIYAETVESDLK